MDSAHNDSNIQNQDELVPIDHWDPQLANRNPVVRVLRNVVSDNPDSNNIVDHGTNRNTTPTAEFNGSNWDDAESSNSSGGARGNAGSWFINNDFYELNLLDESNLFQGQELHEIDEIDGVTDSEGSSHDRDTDQDSDTDHNQDDADDQIQNFENQNNLNEIDIGDIENVGDDYEEVDDVGTEENGKSFLNYDTSLPLQHQYLGENLEELSGREVLLDNELVEIPLLTRLTDTGEVLLPGQTLPLMFGNIRPHVLDQLSACILRGQKTFGIACKSDLTPGTLGTTAEVRNFRMEPDGTGEQVLSSMILEGRQKFQLMTVPRGDALRFGKVKIISESFAQSPCQLQGSLSRLQASRYKRKFDKFRSNKFPPWLHKNFDAHELIDRILKLLQHWLVAPEEIGSSKAIDSSRNSTANDQQNTISNQKDQAVASTSTSNTNKNEKFSSRIASLKHNMDPLEFSYWVAANLPLTNSERAFALTFNCPISRLRWELSLIEEATHLCCQNCGATICHKEDVFSMSRAGPQSSFVNEHGFIHDTLTVLRVNRILLNKTYQETTNYSWFPGYAWALCMCWNCRHHLGWRYKAAGSNVTLKPQTFWGLSRSNIRLTKPSQQWSRSHHTPSSHES